MATSRSITSDQSGIYTIRHIKSGKIYIGSTVQPQKAVETPSLASRCRPPPQLHAPKGVVGIRVRSVRL